MNHVGMDLHTKMAYIRAITDTGELLPGCRVYLSELNRLWEYLDQFGSEPVRVVLEAVGNSRWMYRLLSQRPNVEAVVVTPHKVKIISETISKTDKVDAGKLALLSSIDMLPASWMPDQRHEDLRELVRHRSRLLRDQTRAKNEITGVLVRCGLQRPYDNIFGPLGRRWLDELDLPAVMRLQVDNWLSQIDAVRLKLDSLEGRIRKVLQADPRWSADAALIDTVPGLGPISIMTILAELGDYRRFNTRSQVAAYAGLVPSSKRSAKTARYGKLTKRGPTELRRVLTQAAPAVSRKVPRYQQLYQRIKHQKCANIAKTAVARRVLVDVWTMLIKREPFRLMIPDQAESLARVG